MSKSIKTPNVIGRRAWMKGAALAAGGSAATLIQTGCSTSSTSGGAVGAGTVSVLASENNAVVDTAAGKVRGFTRNGIPTFRGIPYAASPEGPGRFLPPSKPKPWTGVRNTMYFGPTCPQGPRAGWANDENAFQFQWDDGIPGEDCLRVNVWTPGLNDGKKRPVMVWMHGGGYQSGSGQEQPAYDGESLARRGDVVVVTLNHRLGPLGYLNLSAYGPQYEASANVGQLDLIAALEWVRDNIANFGGDPANVLIFGQSGGGGKVTTLLGMPAAKGLFHKAVVQSGSLTNPNTQEDTQKLAAAVISSLGLSRATIGKLHEVPVAKLIEANAAAVAKLGPINLSGRGPLKLLVGPTVDGKYLPESPFNPKAPAVSASVPMLIGTTLNEFNSAATDASREGMTEDELKKQLAANFGANSGKILEATKKIYPTAKPVEIASIVSASMFRNGAVAQAECKASAGGAPAYMYLFCWKTPLFDGRPRAFHCAEIPFVFYNTDVSAFSTGGGEGPRKLAEKVSDAWINFARKGDPNHSGLPAWPVYNAQQGPTMIFDNTCEVRNDPERELRQAILG